MITYKKLTLEDAELITIACKKAATEMGQDMDISVVDDGGNLISFQRMNHARITSIQISMEKAWTAAAARKPTRDYGNAAQPGAPVYGINTSQGGKFSIVPGGLPVFVDGGIVGGIGISSGVPDQDEQIAQAGLDAFLASLNAG